VVTVAVTIVVPPVATGLAELMAMIRKRSMKTWRRVRLLLLLLRGT
jgi:hypothetical protein